MEIYRMNRKTKGTSINMGVFLAVVIAILAITSYFLITGGEEKREVTLTGWRMVDYTDFVGPTNKGVGRISHKSYTKNGTEIHPGEELHWSGSINWNGSENENLGTYGESELGVHLILTENKGTKKVNLILLLGNYSREMGISPLPGDEYIDHDSQIVQELGGKNASDVQSMDLDLVVTYQKS